MIGTSVRGGLFLATGVLLCSSSNLSHAELAATSASATVAVGILRTFEGSATKPSGELTMPVGVGKSQDFTIAVEPCGGASLSPGFRSIESLLPSSLHVWDANVTVRKASLEEIELAVDWKRFDPAAGADKPAASGSEVVSLNEGDYQMLDFRALARSATPNCPAATNALLKVEASVTEDPAFKDRRIDYEVWLVHDGPGGHRDRPWHVTGRHGEKQEFDFPPFSQSLEGSRWPDGDSPVIVETHVGGQIRGRYRPDGRLDVALLAYREFRVANNGGWATGERGRKVVQIAPDEVIRLEIPVTPWAQVEESTGVARTPMRDEQEVRSFLQGEKVSLILKANPSS